MIHIVRRSASIRDLRTQFPKIRRLVEQEGEVVITERGRPVILLKAYSEERPLRPRAVDYWARLQSRMPRPISAQARQELDEADRGER